MEFSTLILIIITACICLYHFILSKLSHFKRLNIPHVRPIPLLGHLAPFVFQRTSLVENVRKIYNLFPDVKYFGFYELMTPVYVLRDPELINTIAIKNFDNFCDHRDYVTKETEPLMSENLFNMNGDHWRKMRKILSPTFTSGKIKIMFKLICECAENLVDFVANDSGNIGKTYDMKDILSRYGNDVVATCAFGVSVNSFKHPNNEFFLLAKESTNFINSPIKLLINKNFPLLGRLLRLEMLNSRIRNFFKQIFADTVKIRGEQKIFRPDMIQLMMESKDKDGSMIEIDEMTGHAFVYLLAGFDSTSSVMSFLTYEVGINFDIQNKLRAEIDDVFNQTNGKPTYEAISQMKYLDAVVNETLRLYPLGHALDRVCVKEFELPPATPDREPVTLKPGDIVWFSHYSLHRDPKYYSEPEKFNPDRFLNGEVDNSVYIPFGIGPRICVAYRFAQIEIKIIMFYLLWRCELEPDTKTTIPMTLNKTKLYMTPKNGFWLKLRARHSKASVI